MKVSSDAPLTNGLPKSFDVWMSHGDRVERLPAGFADFMATDDSPHCAFYDAKRKFYALQFHPEVHHTPLGGEILENFLYNVCGCKGDWVMSGFADTAIREAREKVGGDKAVLGISGRFFGFVRHCPADGCRGNGNRSAGSQPQAQIPVDDFQYLHEVSRPVTVQPL